MAAISTQPPAIIQDMIDATLKGAHIALMRRKKHLHVQTKDDGSKVTKGDYQSQQVIEAELKDSSERHHLQDVKFLMEEQLDGMTPDFAGRNHGMHWIVDPIDGTYGYSRKLGEAPAPWAVSIALEQDGKTIAAVVYEAAESEYATARAEDFTSIIPAAPQGWIFWAHRDRENAYRLEGNFSVTATDPNEPYAQKTVSFAGGYELPILAALPKLSVNFKQARESVLDGSTALEKGARPLIDSFLHHGKEAFCDSCGFSAGTYDDCYSAVAGAMRAADGRASTFFAGCCFPWDASAARLILEKSGTPCVEYAILDTIEHRSMLIAGRDWPTVQRMMKMAEKYAG